MAAGLVLCMVGPPIWGMVHKVKDVTARTSMPTSIPSQITVDCKSVHFESNRFMYSVKQAQCLQLGFLWPY